MNKNHAYFGAVVLGGSLGFTIVQILTKPAREKQKRLDAELQQRVEEHRLATRRILAKMAAGKQYPSMQAMYEDRDFELIAIQNGE